MRLAFAATNTKACSASLLALLPAFFTGCANSCLSGFWNPPNGMIGTVISNPPPTCKLASPKAAIRVVVQVSRSCDLCSGSNRVHTVVLNLSGIDVHSSADAAGESANWQPLLSEPGKHTTQVELLSEKMNTFSPDSTEELAIPAGSYDLVRLRLTRDQTRVDDKPFLADACGKVESNCVIMADGQIAPLVFEADTLEFRLTSEATGGGLPRILPDSNNELLIGLTPVLSMARPFGEATPSFVILPGTARVEPRTQEEVPRIPQGI